MDRFNEIYPLYPDNPEFEGMSDAEYSDDIDYINTLTDLNDRRKRKKEYNFDDWCMIYADDLWYIWCIINDFAQGGALLDKMNYASFCTMCYDNSSKT